MNLKSYECYKDSKIVWINEIPDHWSIHPLKSVANIIMGQSPNSNDINDEKLGILFMQGNAEFSDLYPQPSEYCTSPKKISREGDILMSVRAPVGELNISDKRYGIGRGLCSIKPIKVTRSFLWYYLLKSKIDFNYYSNGSTFDAITIGNLSSFPIIIPKSNEQQQISNYLDKQTAKIDETILKNNELINLLEEKRVALINQVVTKGLNPDVPMKDSGVDIIGDIPENNNMVRLKFLCNIKTGDKDTVNRNPDGKYPFYVRSPIVERIDTYSFDGEAVLMAGDGVGAGKVFHYATGKFDYHQRVYNFHNFKHILPKFIYYYMSSLFSIEIEKGSAKSTVDSVRLPMLEDFLICYPSINEQKQIIEYLDIKIDKIDKTIKKVKENIILLEEYKTSLIHHVVTGKVDVRGEEI